MRISLRHRLCLHTSNRKEFYDRSSAHSRPSFFLAHGDGLVARLNTLLQHEVSWRKWPIAWPANSTFETVQELKGLAVSPKEDLEAEKRHSPHSYPAGRST